jgi:hypothetical protein
MYTQCRNFRGTVWMDEQASERVLRTGASALSPCVESQGGEE